MRSHSFFVSVYFFCYAEFISGFGKWTGVNSGRLFAWRKGSIPVRALTRTPKLGILALGAVEGIDVLSDVANGENFFKAAAKSATNLLGSITLSGYCGAIGSKMFGVTGSMLGTGIGNLENNKLNNMLFD